MDDSRKRSLDSKTAPNSTEPDSKKTALEKAKAAAQKIAASAGLQGGGLNTNNFSAAAHPSDRSVERKVYFPTDKFPGTNFVGLILGPKAQTLKELQQTLKVNLTIKGEGLSQKSGQQNIENINEPQHVHISAPSVELADQAEDYISQICNDQSKMEELKMRQKQLLNQQPNFQVQQQLQQQQQQPVFQQVPVQQAVYDNYGSVPQTGYPQSYSNDIYSQQLQQQQQPVQAVYQQIQPSHNSYQMPSSSGGVVNKVIQVPQDLAGAVIGRGGDQIKQFQLQSSAHIQIDNSPEAQRQPVGTFRNVTLAGTSEQVAKAEMLIANFVQQKTQNMNLPSLGSNLSNMSNNSGNAQGYSNTAGIVGGAVANTNQSGALNYPCQMRIEVPNNKVGLIIGKQGKTVHRIQNTYRCKIDIPLGPDNDNPEVRTLTIGAYSENDLELTKNDIIGVIAYQNMEVSMNNAMNMNNMNSYQNMPQMAPSQAPIPAQVAYSVEVPPESVEHVAQYVQANVIQSKTGCTLQLDKAKCSIIVSGTQDKADLAIAEISNIVQAWQASAAAKKGQGQAAAGKGAESSNGQQQQKYTRAEWQQWKVYYKSQGIEMDDEPPLELRADNYV